MFIIIHVHLPIYKINFTIYNNLEDLESNIIDISHPPTINMIL